MKQKRHAVILDLIKNDAIEMEKAEVYQYGFEILFSSIATCIMVMKKNKVDNNVLFIDATGECVKVTNNNKLTLDNIERIVDVFAKREEIKHFAHLASYEEVSGNNYNLSVSTYVEAEDTREKIDIVKLNAEIKEIVAREQMLRDEIDKIIAEIEVDV